MPFKHKDNVEIIYPSAGGRYEKRLRASGDYTEITDAQAKKTAKNDDPTAPAQPAVEAQAEPKGK